MKISSRSTEWGVPGVPAAAARRFHDAFESELGRTLGKPSVRRLRGMLERIAARAGDHDAARARLRPT